MIDTIVGIVVLFVCIGCALFAEKAFYFSIRPGSFGAWYVRNFPKRMFPFMIWLIRIAGILGAIVVIWVLVDRR